MMSDELVKTRAVKAEAIRAHDDLQAAHSRHPFPWRTSQARNLVDAEGAVVLRPGLTKRAVAAMAREANARAEVAYTESLARLNAAIQAELDATPPIPGVAVAVTIDGKDFCASVPDLLRVTAADVVAGLNNAGLDCSVVQQHQGPVVALHHDGAIPFVSVPHINTAAYRALKLDGWNFEFVRLLPDKLRGRE